MARADGGEGGGAPSPFMSLILGVKEKKESKIKQRRRQRRRRQRRRRTAYQKNKSHPTTSFHESYLKREKGTYWIFMSLGQKQKWPKSETYPTKFNKKRVFELISKTLMRSQSHLNWGPLEWRVEPNFYSKHFRRTFLSSSSKIFSLHLNFEIFQLTEKPEFSFGGTDLMKKLHLLKSPACILQAHWLVGRRIVNSANILLVQLLSLSLLMTW